MNECIYCSVQCCHSLVLTALVESIEVCDLRTLTEVGGGGVLATGHTESVQLEVVN